MNLEHRHDVLSNKLAALSLTVCFFSTRYNTPLSSTSSCAFFCGRRFRCVFPIPSLPALPGASPPANIVAATIFSSSWLKPCLFFWCRCPTNLLFSPAFFFLFFPPVLASLLTPSRRRARYLVILHQFPGASTLEALPAVKMNEWRVLEKRTTPFLEHCDEATAPPEKMQ